MRGTARRITIIILVILTIVLIGLGIALALGLIGQQQPAVAVPGAACTQGTAAQCQAGNNGNTGQLCTCTETAGSYKWNCDTTDLVTCPLTSTTCNNGETRTGDCGTSGCQAGERPLSTCNNGQFGNPVCTVDASCTGGSTSSMTSSAASSVVSSSVSSSISSSISSSSTSSEETTSSATSSSVSSEETTTSQSTSIATSASSNLPDTGLFDEDGRPLLAGLLCILIAILFNRSVFGRYQVQTAESFESGLGKRMRN